MRIAFVVGSFPELSSTFILDQVTGLLDRGHDVHVFARVPENEPRVHEDYYRYNLAERTHYWWAKPSGGRETLGRTAALLREDPRRHGAALLRAFDFPRHGKDALSGRYWSYASMMLRHGPFDVVLAQFGTNGRIAQKLRAMGAFDAPIATTWLGYDLTRIVREHGPGYYRDLFTHGDLMLPLSESFRSRLIALGCPEEKCRIHHLGVDAARFDWRPRALREGERVRIVTVCRLVEKKGLDSALRALALVSQRGAQFEYHLAGSGPKRDELERLRDELGLQDRVTFHGPCTRDEVRTLLDRGHVFLSPSVTASDGDEEGTPAAIMEAMASGLPVVSSVHSGIPEVIEDGVSGLLAPERDVERLATHLEMLITRPASWLPLARAARDRIEQHFNLTRLNDQLSDLLLELAGHRC